MRPLFFWNAESSCTILKGGFGIYEKNYEKYNDTFGHYIPIEKQYDLKDWKDERDFTNINPKLEMAIDAPNFLTIGKDVIVNVATDIQYLGYKLVESLFREYPLLW